MTWVPFTHPATGGLVASASAPAVELPGPADATTLDDGAQGATFVIPMLVPEGVPTGDGRRFQPLALRTRDLPLPLMWQIKTGAGHDGSVVVGRIDSIERLPGGLGNARGVFDTGPYGREAERMVRHKFLRGVSADLDNLTAVEEDSGLNEFILEGPDGDERMGTAVSNPRVIISNARIMGATLVAKPAFQEARIELVMDDPAAGGDTVEVSAEPLDIPADLPLMASAVPVLDIPVTPPADWFDNPRLERPTALTVTDDGRVFGHIAAWDVDHIGLPWQRPPRSPSGYAYFHTGALRTADGRDVSVGQLTLAGGHAPLSASADDAVRHYDSTESAVADIHAGEDSHGIWVAGALRPGTTPDQVRVLRASAPSGDWRPINGRLELVAICQVNVPGFPIARAMVAAGHVSALVAAGSGVLVAQRLAAHGGLEELSARVYTGTAPADASRMLRARHTGADRAAMAVLGDALPDGSLAVGDRSDLRLALAAYNGLPEAARPAARRHLRARARALGALHLVPGGWAEPALLREEFDYVVSTVDRGASPRGLTADDRAALAASGAALPDGSVPVRSADDLRRALRSYGSIAPAARPAAREHLCSRARALGREDLLPEAWVRASAVRARLALTAGAGAGAPESLTPERAEDLLRAVTALAKMVFLPGGQMRAWDETKHLRDDKGRFREKIASIRDAIAAKSGTKDAVDAADRAIAAAEAGDDEAAKVQAEDVIKEVDAVADKTIDSQDAADLRGASAALGEFMGHAPLPQGDEASKMRYTDLHPEVQKLVEDMLKRLKDDVSPDVYNDLAHDLLEYMRGGDYMDADEIHSNLAKIMRMII